MRQQLPVAGGATGVALAEFPDTGDTVDGDPFIAVRTVGNGRSAIFASDCGPHWGPPAFLAWEGYGRLWINLVNWLKGA